MAATILVLTTGCYDYHEDTYLEELDITLTYYDNQTDFNAYTTFAIRDSVGLLTNYLSDDEIEDFYKPGSGSDRIRAYVKQKFTDLGYTYVENDEPFTFAVNLTVALINSEVYVSYPGWWWGYYPYYSYYYPYWYPWYGYPWYYGYYEYQSGTLVLEFADGQSVYDYREWAAGKTQEEIENADPDEVPEVEMKWQALVSGVAGTSADYNSERAERGINEAFDQSPYLKKD
jgi:hypothetical protein